MNTVKRGSVVLLVFVLVFSCCTVAMAAEPVRGDAQWMQVHSAEAQESGVPLEQPLEQPLVQAEALLDGVLLNWQNIADAQRYLVYRSETREHGYVLVAEVPVSVEDGETPCYHDANQTEGIVWFYRVEVWNSQNQSALSDAVQALVLPPGDEQSEPAEEIQQAEPVLTLAFEGTQLQWQAVPDAQGYEIWRSTKQDSGFEKIAVCTQVGYYDAQADASRTYYYKVRALLSSGYGAFSNVVTARSALAEVTGVSVKSAGYNSLDIAWKKVAGANRYKIYRATSEKGAYKAIKLVGNKTGYTDTGLAYGKTYYYKVAACKGDRVLAKSSPVSGAPKFGRVSGVKMMRWSASSVMVSWDHLPGAQSYKVYRSTQRDSGYQQVAQTDGKPWIFEDPYPKKRKLVDSGLQEGKVYYYYVVPCRNEKNGPKSSLVKTPKMNSTVKGVKAQATGEYGDVQVSWNKLEGAGVMGYLVSFKIDPQEYDFSHSTDGRVGSAVLVSAGQSSHVLRGLEPRNLTFEVVPVWGSQNTGNCAKAATARPRVKAEVQRFIDMARQQVGKPYLWGGLGPDSFDCSGLVYYCLNKSGRSIGYLNSHAWYSSSYPWVAQDQLRPGDILTRPGHVEIYVGGGMVIDGSSANARMMYRSASIQNAKRVFH